MEEIKMTTRNLRSKLGGHFAGNGMGYSSKDSDNYLPFNMSKYKNGCRLSTDNFSSDKDGRKAFEEYCEKMSGEVKVYHISELQEV
jgi:hypothetical protein